MYNGKADMKNCFTKQLLGQIFGVTILISLNDIYIIWHKVSYNINFYDTGAKQVFLQACDELYNTFLNNFHKTTLYDSECKILFIPWRNIQIENVSFQCCWKATLLAPQFVLHDITSLYYTGLIWRNLYWLYYTGYKHCHVIKELMNMFARLWYKVFWMSCFKYLAILCRCFMFCLFLSVKS